MTKPINTQPISKPAVDDGETLLVHSIFWTIQGEGPLVGQPAVFLRLAGCNLKCPGCDTLYTEGAYADDVEGIIEDVEAARPKDTQAGRLLIITGGEPFRQNIAPFIDAITAEGWFVQVETNGVLKPQDFEAISDACRRGDLAIVVSPKTSRVDPDLASVADAYKYVISASSMSQADGLPILALGNKCHPYIARPPEDRDDVAIYVNPMDEYDVMLNAANNRAVVDSCMKYGYIAGVQLHKIFDLE